MDFTIRLWDKFRSKDCFAFFGITHIDPGIYICRAMHAFAIVQALSSGKSFYISCFVPSVLRPKCSMF